MHTVLHPKEALFEPGCRRRSPTGCGDFQPDRNV